MASNLTAAEARKALGQADGARAAVLQETAPPVAWHAAVSLAMGAFVLALRVASWWPTLAGVVVLVALAVVDALLRRRRGRLTDDNAVTSGMGRYALWYIPCSILFALVRTGGWPWWAAGLAAACVAVATFVFLRADTRYQDRRLARGDYRPWDLT